MARIGLAVAMSVLLGLGPAACGGAPEPTGAGGGAPTTSEATAAFDAEAYLAAVVAGEVTGAAVTGGGGHLVVVGGMTDPTDEGYEVVDHGVVVGEEGVVRTFAAGVRLVDQSAAVTGGRLVLAGRRCDGRAEIGDTGVACSPGVATVVTVELTSGEASELALPSPPTDTTGASVFVEAMATDGRAVIRTTTAEGAEWWVGPGDGISLEHLTTGIIGTSACVTSGALLELRRSPTSPDQSTDPSEWDAEARPLTLQTFDLAAGRWVETAPSPAASALQTQLACTSDRAVVLAAGDGPTSGLAYDPTSDTWGQAALPVTAGPLTIEAGPDTALVLAVAVDGAGVVFDPVTLGVTVSAVQADPTRPSPVAAVGPRSFGRLHVGPPTRLETLG